MSVATCLRAARALLSTGWAEPFSIDERGAAGATLKNAEKLCLDNAIFWSAADVEEGLAAWSLVEATCCPNTAALDAVAGRAAGGDDVALEAARFFARALVSAGELGGLQGWLEKKWRTLDQVLALLDRALVRTLRS